MRIGDLLEWRGRVYRLLGFDPMGVADRHAHLEDDETGERVLAPASEIEPDEPDAAG